MAIDEMYRLQGMDPARFKVSSLKSAGQQIGNAMSVNVIERILYQALLATQTFGDLPLEDNWATGEAYKKLHGRFHQPNYEVPTNPSQAVILSAHSQRNFIADSGASYHLISSCDLTPEELETLWDQVKNVLQ